MRKITMGWQRLDQLPVPLVWLGIGVCSVLLAVSGWWWGLQPWWQDNRLQSNRSHRLNQQVLTATRAILQIPLLTRRLAAPRSLTPTTLSTQITQAAVSSQVFISDLTETDPKHAQATLLGSFAQLQAFLQRQSQQWSPWLITEVQFQQSPALDSPVVLHLHWQRRQPEPLQTTPCPAFQSAKLRRDPFQAAPATYDLTRYSLAQIEWLGIVKAPHQIAALIRLPNQDIRLISPGMMLGQEQWRLQQLTPAYAQFIDADQHSHRWPLHQGTPTESVA